MKIFFAGSIRAGRDDAMIYETISKILASYGTVLTQQIGNQVLAEKELTLNTKDIYEREMNALKEANVVIAEVTTPSLGVGYELSKAEELHKNILCIYRSDSGRNLSAMISGNKNFNIVQYETIEELPEILKTFLESQV